MPITMMFAARHIGAKYRDYARDHRVLAEAQLRTAETFGFDYVSAISDPAREASDLGAAIEWFDDQPPAILESQALLAEKSRLTGLAYPIRRRRRACTTAWKRCGCCAEDRAGSAGGRLGGRSCAMSADLRGVNTLMLDFFDDPGLCARPFRVHHRDGTAIRDARRSRPARTSSAWATPRLR